MGLFQIVQYEVQVFQDGHWCVRARYTRSERDHAFTEARRIDLNESHPARVVRDVFDPHSGRSQEFTTFMSDRARALKAGIHTAPAETPIAQPEAKNAPARPGKRPAPFAFRATMAIGVGVVTALLLTAVATWALTPHQVTFASVLARSPAPGPAMTLFVAVVLFSVFTLLRGALGISRLARTLSASFRGEAAAPLARMRSAPRVKEAVPRAAAPTLEQDTHVLPLACVMLARFVSDAATECAPDDSRGLNGVALYLAGAASELASHLEMPSPADLLERISSAPLRDATMEALVNLRAADAADAALVAAGRSGMRKYVTSPEERPSMAGALAAWHKAARPVAQTTAANKAS